MKVKLKEKIKVTIMFIITFAILFGLAMFIYVIPCRSSDETENSNVKMEATEVTENPEEKEVLKTENLDYKTGGDTEENLVSLGEFRCTAYCSCEECCDEYAFNRPVDEYGNEIVYTASGNIAIQGITIAADTRILPFGTEVYINGHKFVVQDIGGGIISNKIDIYFNDHEEAKQFGVQYLEVFIKGE